MSSPTPVSVVGLGPMGQAMTHTLLAAGHRVTVWNRTPSRAAEVVAAGARLSETPGQALDASSVVLLSLTDYAAMTQILGGYEAQLNDRVLVNLSSDTPTRTREASTWAGAHGATFLAGGIMVPAAMVGSEDASVYYSGDEASFERHRELLARIGEPRFLGADPGRAQLMYQAHLDLFLTALAGIAHATALVSTAGIGAQAFLPDLMQLFTTIPAMIAMDGPEALGRQIDAGAHPADGSTNAMLGASADHVVATSRAVGVDAALPAAVQDLYRQARRHGWERDGWTRAVELLRDPRDPL